MTSTSSWETAESQVPKESVEKLLKSFFYAEQVRWLESSSPLVRNISVTSCSCCNSSHSRDGNHCGKLDPGFKILRHAKNIRAIHAYFQNLEPHRYRLKLTARNKVHDRPHSSMRVVRNDSRVDSNPRSNQSETTETDEQTALTDQEWQLYEMVVKCYKSPYLTAPPAPSPYSPSSSPTASFGPQQPGFDDFSYSPPPRANIHSPFRSRRFSFRFETSPEPLPPVKVNTMRELVRKTFELTKGIHTAQEKAIQEKMLPKNADRVLVEDLLTQLYYLNNNCHPYYHIQSFIDTSSYDEWVTAEKENINRRIKEFWNFPLPPCTSAYPLTQPDAHNGYITLLKQFVRCESSYKKAHSVFGDVTPTGPLSPAACRILKEFGLRYGVGELYRKLVYLKYLANHFESKLWYIQHVAMHLEDVMNLVTMTPEIYVKEEFVMLLHLLTLLLRVSKYYLTRVIRLFPKNSPPGGVTSLVTMAKLSQDAALYLRANFSSAFTAIVLRDVVREFTDSLEDEPFETLLARYLQEEVEGRYERFKVIAADKLEVDFYEVALTPHLLNILIYDIQEEITLYKTYYQCEFESYVDFVKLATVQLYGLLMTDVQEMYVHIPGNVRREKVDLRMLALAYRLSILDRDLAKYLTLEMQTWREPLLQLALDWMDIVGGHQKGLISSLFKTESWHAVEVTQEDNKPKAVLTNKILKINQQHLFTRSENSAFSKVRNVSEPVSNNQERTESSPNLSSARVNPTQTSENLLHVIQTSSSSSDGTETQPKPPRRSEFKGQTIVTTASIHIPKQIDSSLKSDGGLSRSCPIEEICAIEKSSESAMNIEDIDQCGDHRKTSEESEDDISKLYYERLVVDYVHNFSGLASQAHKTGQTSSTGQTGQTGDTDQTSQTSQTRQISQTEENGPTQEIKAIRNEQQDIQVGQTTETSQSSLQMQTSQSGPDTSHTSLIGQVTDRTTPYETSDHKCHISATSSDYRTAESSPSRSDLSVETVSAQSDVVHEVSEVACPSSDVEGTASDIEHRTSDIASDTSNVDPSHVEQLTSHVCRNSSVVCFAPENVGPAVEVVSDDSKIPIPSTTGQNPQEFRSGAKEHCENCPHKVANTVSDIEDVAINDEDDNHVKTQISDEEWNKPGPSGLQPPVVLANKHLSKALESDVTSLKSAATEYGSLPSRVTITSYETARYSSNSSNKCSDFESTFTTSYESCDDRPTDSDVSAAAEEHLPKKELLPISSSVIDLLCSVNRLTAFTCHLCSILCPNDGLLDTDELRNKTLRIKTDLCGRLIQIVKEMILLYNDSLLAVETCGMTNSELVDVIGERLARDVFDRYTEGRLVGCRLNPGRRTRCNTTNSRGKMVQQCSALTKIQRSVTGCESVSSKMGLRSSDVTVVKSLLSWLHDRITLKVSCHKSMAVGIHGNSGECQRLSHLSETYCQNGPSVDSNKLDFQQECQRRHGNESRVLSQSIDETLDECAVRLDQLFDIQCKLVAHRLNDLFKKILHQLLSLSLPTFDNKKRLQPIIDFLYKRLTSLRKVMFPESFMVTLKYLWRHVVEDFSEEVELLKERRRDATDQAVLVLNSMAYLMQFFHGQGKGLTFDDLISSTESVTKHIELYTTPTQRLIHLYQWLADQMVNVRREQLRNVDEFTSSVSSSSHLSRAHTPTDDLLQSLRLELHSTRKCFSGTDLVDWVRDYVREHGYDSLGVCIGITDTDTGIELGQYLLEKNVLVCVTAVRPHCVTQSDDSEGDDDACAKSTRSRNSKGTVFMKDSIVLPSQMRFNEISIHKGSSTPQPSSHSNSRPATETSELCDSSDSLQSEDLDTRELLDSVDIILRHAQSDQSLVQFQYSPDVFYSFISDDDGSGGEFKYKLDFRDRFSIRVKLEQIVCVLFSRKRKDSEAKQFLKRLSKDFIAQAIGYKETPLCFHI